jgi:hypothetical protein
MVHVDPSTKFPDLRPAGSGPPLYHLLGFGLYLYGERDCDEETESFVRTLCFCVLYIPVLAWRAYRVAPLDDGWVSLGRVPVSRPAGVFSLVGLIALLGGGGYLAADAYLNSPGVVVARKMAAAERLAAGGSVGEAARLLGEVAAGSSEQARPAAQRLAKLLDDPASKSDPEGRGAAFRAAVDLQKAGRWPVAAQTLHDSGLALARDSAATDPRGAWAILDAIEPLIPQDQADAELRHSLLEKIVAADPSNPEWASRLAVAYEARGELARSEKFLAPLRTRLGELEGARVLALVDARANRLEQAIPLLRDYTRSRLARLAQAETRLRSLAEAAQKRIIGQLERQHVADFNYNDYRFATDDRKQQIVLQYLSNRIRSDPEIARAEQALVAESKVAPVAMELGILLLQHAQAQADPPARQALLQEAEATFLAVSRMAGDRADVQLSLAQVYYWQGKHVEGRRLFDEVLKARNRDPALLLEVASLLRHVGSHSDARSLAEEGYRKATDARIRSNCAVVRGLLGNDIEDRILWLRRADANEPNVKAILCGDLATQALEKGDEAQAISNLRQAVALYDAMPESAGMLNNASLALRRLANLTGDPAAYERAGTMIERAAALDPGNSLTMSNAAESLLEAGLRDIIGRTIDLKVLKTSADLDLLGFLIRDESGRRALADRLRAHSVVNRALASMEKVILLAPRNPGSYTSLMRVLAYRGDAAGLARVRGRLAGVELDLDDRAKQARETYDGGRDKQNREAVLASLARFEPILPVARAKGGPTFAVAVSYLLGSRIVAATYSVPADADALVALAEAGFAAAPVLRSRSYLVEALLFRSLDRLARADRELASLRDGYLRAVSHSELLASVLSKDGPLKDRVLRDADVSRAIDLLREEYAASPTFASNPRSWSLLRAKYPDVAATMARGYLADASQRIEAEIEAKLQPYDPTVFLKIYRTARMRNHDAEGSQALAEARSRGIPIPILAP